MLTASPTHSALTIKSFVMSPVPADLVGGETPFLPFEAPLSRKEDWQVAAELLPVRDPREFYTLRDIEPHVGRLNTKRLSEHAAAVFPTREGYYRLSFIEAVFLIRRVCDLGRKRHSRQELERLWREKYLIDIAAPVGSLSYSQSDN